MIRRPGMTTPQERTSATDADPCAALPPWPLPGERAPDFHRPMLDRADAAPEVASPFERLAGRPAVMAAAEGPAAAALATRLGAGLAPDRPAFLVAAGLPAAALAPLQAALAPSGTQAPRLVFADSGPLIGFLLGGGRTAAAVWALDGCGRVLAACAEAAAEDALTPWLAALGPAPAAVASPAPVLLIPGVLEPALCHRLIAAHAADNAVSGMPRRIGGRIELVPDLAAKSRRDHALTDAALSGAVLERLRRRVLPEIRRTFHYPVTRMEGFKIVAYHAPGPDSPGGWFRPHRDNTAPGVAHRRFALTLNLDDGYEGGGLVLPEFGPTAYRPPAGGALVFSCAHLHEATEVTRGTRHVLLTFLFGDEAPSGPGAQRRQD
jgi:predicted 2-oxoglutarate/Fe(II)-dependent dioxygenase YbiX